MKEMLLHEEIYESNPVMIMHKSALVEDNIASVMET